MLGHVGIVAREIVVLLLFFLQNYLNPICAPHPHLPPLCNCLCRRELEIKYRISGTVLHSCRRASSLDAQITPAGFVPSLSWDSASGGKGEMNVLLGISEGHTGFELGRNVFTRKKIAVNPVWQHEASQCLLTSVGFAPHS